MSILPDLPPTPATPVLSRRWTFLLRTGAPLGLVGSLLYGGWLASNMLHTLRTVERLLVMQQSQLMMQHQAQLQAQVAHVKTFQWMATHLRPPPCEGNDLTRFAGKD
jgi:hypothetical protein